LETGQGKEEIPAHLESWLLVIFVTSVIAVDHSVPTQPVELLLQRVNAHPSEDA
jgi:hypothetical protein